jgi:hypothetical protein
MTTSMPSALPASSRLRYLAVPVAASIIHLLIMIPGYNEDGRFRAGLWLTTLAMRPSALTGMRRESS